MCKRLVRFVCLSTVCACTALALRPGEPLLAEAAAINPADSVTATLVADVTAIAPGTPFAVGVKFDIPPGYYTYYRTPGSIGLPTKVSITAPKGFAVGPIEFPSPVVKHDDIAGSPIENFVYTHGTVVFATIMPPASGLAGTADFSANVSFQYCKESGVCVAPRPQTLKLSLPVVASRQQSRPSESAAAFAAARRMIPLPSSQSKYLKAQLVLSQDKLRPGDRTILGAVVDVQPGHKLQMHRPPVDAVISTDLILDNVPGIEPIPYPTYPAPDAPKSPAPGFEDAYEYHGRFVITAPAVATDSLTGNDVRFTGVLRYQACTTDGSCYPPQFVALELVVPVAGKNSPVAAAHHDVFSAALRGTKPPK